MKRTSKIIVMSLLIVFLFNAITINPNAASYPTIAFCSDENFQNIIVSAEAPAGEVYKIRMLWDAAFNSESYDMKIYNSSGSVVTTSNETWQNTSYMRRITVDWDTSNCKPGDYTVEVTKKFYSFYNWHEAPTKSTLKVTLKPNYKISGIEEELHSMELSSKYKKSVVKKATRLKLDKDYSLKISNGKGVIKFKAPKTRKYKLLYSNVGTLSGATAGGFAVIYQYKNNKKVRVCSAGSFESNQQNVKKTKKLKKGETYYIQFFARTKDDPTSYVTFRIE